MSSVDQLISNTVSMIDNNIISVEYITNVNTKIIYIKDQQFYLQSTFNSKCLTDIAIGYIYEINKYHYLNIGELKDVMKEWKNLRKKGHLTLQECDNKIITIGGKNAYILTLQTIYANEIINTGIDTCSLGFDIPQIITGNTYIFKNKENRDMVYKYVMGL